MKRIGRRLRSLRSERGAALVEFGLVLPFLMIMVCAAIDFGISMYTLNNLTAAVREGGRYAATRVPVVVNDPVVIDRVYNYIAAIGSSQTPAQVRATISTSAVDANGNITVKITGYQYRAVTPIASLFGLSTLTMNRTAIFRWELANN